MDCGTFTFGKYIGTPACDVPFRYLVWAASNMASPPPCVLEELRSRAARLGSREAMNAQVALSTLAFKRARIEARRARKDKEARTEVVGARFAESRREWIASGGDLLACPF